MGNAITDTDFIAAFEAAVDDANADDRIRAVILTGDGKIFSAGGNVKEMADRRGMFGLTADRAAPRLRRRTCSGSRGRWPASKVPLIAAVNGPAIGAGCDLAMMCDIRIASERASFAESFVQLGLIPGDGGTWFLPRAIGHERAAEMTFTGDRVDAATALRWGMVSRVVPHDELLAGRKRSRRAHRQEPAARAADGQTAAAGVAHRIAGIDAGDGRGHATAGAPRRRTRAAHREVERPS